MTAIPAGAAMLPVHGRGSLHAAVETMLQALRQDGRRAVRIVDLDCGSGRRLARIARRARALGFTAIEARGCARTAGLVEVARHASLARRDPAIELAFDATDADAALAQEAEAEADLIIVERAPEPRHAR